MTLDTANILAKLAEKFGCISHSDFKLAFGVSLMAAAESWDLLELPEWTEPIHLLLTLNGLTGVTEIDGLNLLQPPPEEIPEETDEIVTGKIHDLWDSIMPQSKESPKNVQQLNQKMGLKLSASNPLRQKVEERKFFQVLYILKELDCQRDGTQANFDLAKLSVRWGRINEGPGRLLKTLKAVAVLEQIESEAGDMEFANLTATEFEGFAADLTANSKLPFESIFYFHQGLCATIWNRTLPLTAKPWHLLQLLLVLRARDDSPFHFAECPKLEKTCFQRVLRPIAAQYWIALKKMAESGATTNVASLSVEWKIMECEESLRDPNVFRSIIVLNWMANEWATSDEK